MHSNKSLLGVQTNVTCKKIRALKLADICKQYIKTALKIIIPLVNHESLRLLAQTSE